MIAVSFDYWLATNRENIRHALKNWRIAVLVLCLYLNLLAWSIFNVAFLLYTSVEILYNSITPSRPQYLKKYF